MKLQKTPIALAAIALCSAAPIAANAAPTVSWRAPAEGATISQDITNSSACEVAGSNIRRVVFQIRRSGTTSWTNFTTDLGSPWRCNIDIDRYTSGAYQLRAVAYDSANVARTALRDINISRGGSTTPPPPPPPDDGGTTTPPPTGGTTTPPPTATTTPAWVAPAAGATISQDITNSSACEVSAANIQRVVFQIRRSGTTRWTNFTTDFSSPWRCNLDVSDYTAGAYQLRAVAYDMSNVARTAMRDISIGTATSGGDTANTAPTVSLTAPTAGATLADTASYAAEAADTNTGGSITRVDFFLENSAGARTLIGSRTSAPFSGTFNTASHANGTYQLMAMATDNGSLTSWTQRAVTIANTVSTNNPPPASGLPSTGTRAVATYESLGLYWSPGTNPGAAGCTVRYRKASESTWKDGLAMWYDARNSECRGSLVHLASGTDYVVQFSLPGQQPSRELAASTWSDSKPIAQTVHVTSGSTQINITQGGTANGYVLYTPAPGTQAVRDVDGNADYNIAISAPYVIVRGLTLRNARIDGIRLLPGARDVIIEDNDISGWGRFRNTVGGEQVGVDRDSAVRADCRNNAFLERITVQRNRMHDPRYTTNSWDNGHPLGPQAVTYSFCPGNHVIRYNEVYSATGTKYLNDGFSGEDNFSNVGFPNHDSDIYGNRISHVWDDAIEAEGANRNVRIWNNYMDRTGTGVATSTTATGPVYIWRNVYNRSQKLKGDGNANDRLVYLKSGSHSTYGNGRRYVFHNTMLQATAPGLSYTLGAGGGLHGSSSTQPLTNTVSRNNILHVWRTGWNSINTVGGGGNDLDYDLRNGGTAAYSGAEPNGLIGVPTYASGHGWQSESGGNYQLAPGSLGHDRGARIPNFNDGFTGNAPDFGAHEGGTPAMRFGIQD